MNKLTQEESRRRKAVIEDRLRNIPFLWKGHGRELYLSADGYYVVRVIITSTRSDYIGISPEGELKGTWRDTNSPYPTTKRSWALCRALACTRWRSWSDSATADTGGDIAPGGSSRGAAPIN
jgi:hypothetical protein